MRKASLLNRKAHSLLKGAASVMSLNARTSPRVEVILQRSNAQALAGDWNAVGGDIRSAMNAYESTCKHGV